MLAFLAKNAKAKVNNQGKTDVACLIVPTPPRLRRDSMFYEDKNLCTLVYYTYSGVSENCTDLNIGLIESSERLRNNANTELQLSLINLHSAYA